MTDEPAYGIWRHWKGHPYQVLFVAYLLRETPEESHLYLFGARCSTNGPDDGRTLTVGVHTARPDASYPIAYPTTGVWEPPEGARGVVYVGLTLDGEPKPGHRVRVRELGEFTGTVEVDDAAVPRFTFLAEEWHPRMTTP